MMPGSAHTLHVVGDIDVGNVDDGYELKFESLEKSNPPTLILKIVEVMILIPRQAGDTHLLLHYTESPAPEKLAGVSIVFPDGTSKSIEQIGRAF